MKHGLRGGRIARAAVLLLLACTACGATAPAPGKDDPRGSSYEGSESFENPTMILASYEVPVTLEGERTAVEIDAPPHLPRLMARWIEGAAGETEPPRIGLVLHGVQAPRTGTYHDLYAGLSAGARPDPESPYYLGTISSFGPEGARTELAFDLTDVVERLAGEDRWGEELLLTFVRRGLEPPANPAERGALDSDPVPEPPPGSEPPPVEIEMIRIVRE